MFRHPGFFSFKPSPQTVGPNPEVFDLNRTAASVNHLADVFTLNSAGWVIRVQQIAVMALAYFFAGRLGLLLGIPAGYATPVWPAAGVALAGVLLCGYPISLGIFLGSVLLNVLTAFDAPSASPISHTLAVAASIAVGASLQATIGALLIRRFTHYPRSFVDLRDIVCFLVLGGPVSCLFNATWSVTTLALDGVIPWSDFLVFWWAWWMRNSIGVVTFATLGVIWLGRLPHFSRRRQVLVSSPLVIALAVVVLASIYVNTREKNRIESLFERRTDNLTQEVKGNLQNNIDVLHSLERLYASSNAVTRQDFKHFVAYWFTRYPGIRTLAWNPWIKESERAFVEQTARGEGFTNFEIRERDPNGKLVRAGRRAEYVPVLYLETRQDNRKALGYDAAVDPIRRHALDVARDTGKPIATDRTTLVRDRNDDPGFVVFLPVFKSGRFQSVEERRRNLRGYVSGAFRIRDIVNTLQSTTGFIDINIRVSEQTNGLANPLPQGTNVPTAITNRAPIRQVPAPVTLYRTVSFQSAGRTWNLEFTPTKEYMMLDQKEDGQTGILLLGGMLSTGLLSTFLLAVTGYIVKLNAANTDLKKEMNERTAAQNEIRKYAVIVDSLDEAIIGSTWGGNIITWNQAAANLYGYTEEEVVGHHISIIYPPRLTSEIRYLRENLEAGKPVIQYETVRLRKDKTEIPVSITLSPMKDAAGNITGVASVSSDIRARKQMESALQRQRENIAHQLHDSVLQSLTAINLHLGMAKKLLPHRWTNVAKHLESIETVLFDEQRSLRVFVSELRDLQPRAPGEDDRERRLMQAMVKRLAVQWNVRVEFDNDVRTDPFPSLFVDDLMYLIQEGVANAVRHGQATIVQVKISQIDNNMVLRITDNGRGFQAQNRNDGVLTFNASPKSLNFRAASLGGTLSICSSDTGACIEIVFPLSSLGVHPGDRCRSYG